MKKAVNKSLAFLLAAVMILFASPIIGVDFSTIASAADENDLAFRLINNDTAFEISACGWTASGDLIIPATFGGLPVISIGKFAFYDCTDLKSVTIPASVKNIGVRAFQYCKGFESIVIPNSVTNIDEYAFYYCDNLKSITFAAGSKLEHIGSDAFAGCSKLESIIIPESVTSIDEHAFFECQSLASVTFAEGTKLERISKSMFTDCSELKSIIIPKGITSIDDNAFFRCSGLESITFAADSELELIDSYAFEGCSKLESIIVPEGVTSIGRRAFLKCNSLSEIDVAQDNANYFSEDGVLFTKDGKTLVCYPAGKSDTSYDIPAGVTSIGDSAFFNCSELSSINIPTSVTSIGESAFEDTAYYSEKNNWTNGALYIDDCFIAADSECTSCNIAQDTRLIADAAFFNAYELKEINVPESNASFSSENGILFSKDRDVLISYPQAKNNTLFVIPSGVEIIAAGAFYDCDALESITISKDVTSIGEQAFEDCDCLLSVTFDQDIKLDSIKNRTFYYCSCLLSIDIPDGVTSIGNDAFEDCTRLESVTIPEGVTSIGEDAFMDCEALESVTIPESVIDIGEDAFDDCDDILDIYYGGDESDWENVNLGPDSSEIFDATWHFSIVVTDVTLDITSKTLTVGATQQLAATVAPDNATNKAFVYTSSDTAIATVDKDGLVTAKAEGTATITVTTRNKSKTAICLLTVKENEVEKIDILTQPNTLTYTYKKNLFDKTGLTIRATYTNGDIEIITNTEEIDVTGFDSNQTGEQQLTVEYGGKQAEEKITVTVKYVWWQWLIRILLFGWIWY